MQLAHTLGANGPDVEFLMIAVSMLVLGVIFFLQKTAKPVVSVVLVVGAFALAVGAFAVGGRSDDAATAGPASDISIEILSPRDGATVPADEPVPLEIRLEGGDGGHFDVRVDGDIATMTAASDPEVTFSPGPHEVQVEYVTSRHESYDPPVTTSISITAE